MTMEIYNLLANRMRSEPPFHAVIELQEKTGGWFYGYLVVLKESCRRCPLPDERSATAQRAVPQRDIALLFALYDLTKTEAHGSDDWDEDAVAGALREEAEKRLAELAGAVLVKHRAAILRCDATRVRLSYILPKNLHRHLKLEELFVFGDAPAAAAEQLSLF